MSTETRFIEHLEPDGQLMRLAVLEDFIEDADEDEQGSLALGGPLDQSDEFLFVHARTGTVPITTEDAGLYEGDTMVLIRIERVLHALKDLGWIKGWTR